MEMRTVPVTYPHYAVGDRVMRKNRTGIIGTVVGMSEPTDDSGAIVDVQWDVQSSVFVHRPAEIEPLPEPPITNDERMEAILTSGHLEWKLRIGHASVWVNGVTFNGDTPEQAIDAFVRWKRKQPKTLNGGAS